MRSRHYYKLFAGIYIFSFALLGVFSWLAYDSLDTGQFPQLSADKFYVNSLAINIVTVTSTILLLIISDIIYKRRKSPFFLMMTFFFFTISVIMNHAFLAEEIYHFKKTHDLLAADEFSGSGILAFIFILIGSFVFAANYIFLKVSETKNRG